ncbi:MAG: hypothetical protein K0R22_3407 [Sporomusa sp.]|nr:hypothetical protein [Sporomusa sp.]
MQIDSLISEIGKCCLEEELCDQCKKEKCLIGFCKKSLLTVLKQKSEFISNGMHDIPYSDTKVYDTDAVINSIGFLLNQCRNCNVYHDDECIINIIRASLEVILLGEVQEYRGSTLMYLGDIQKVNSEVAAKILHSVQQRN